MAFGWQPSHTSPVLWSTSMLSQSDPTATDWKHHMLFTCCKWNLIILSLCMTLKQQSNLFFFFFLLATELLSYSAELKRLVLFLCLHVKYEATVLWKMYRQLSLIPLSLLADVPMVYIFKILGYRKVNLWPRGHWDLNSFLLDSPKVSYVTSFSTWASTLPTGRGDDNTPSTSHGWGVKTATLGWA